MKVKKMPRYTPEHHYGLGWRPQKPDHRDFRLDKVIRFAPETLPPSANNAATIARVKDQGQLGACTAFGTTSLFESTQIRLQGKDFQGDELYEYRNARILSGSYPGDNGADVRSAVKATAQYGVCPEADWPYNISQFDQTPPAKCATDAVKAESTSFYLLDSTAGTNQTMLNIKGLLAQGLNVVFGSPVYAQIENVGSDGIIDMPQSGEADIGGHCMMLFGYNDAIRRFNLLNSWSEVWGAPFTGFGGKRFSGGMGLWDYGMVEQGLATDHWAIAMESEIVPTPTPGPAPPAPTQITVASAPSVCISGTLIDMVVRGSDSAVWWRHYDGAKWGAWVSLGGKTAYAPAISTPAAGALNVFAHGADDKLYHKQYQSGTWSAWGNLGGALLKGTSPSSADSFAFVQGTDNAVWYRTLVSAKWLTLGSVLK